MILITIGIDGVPSEQIISLGNKYENLDEEIHFTFPEEFKDYNKYVISILKANNEKYTSVLPINDDVFKISTQLTQYAGKWNMYVMCRENSKLDLSTTPVNIAAAKGERVFISDGFVGKVSDSEIDKESIDNLTLDANLDIIYNEMLSLKAELEKKINTPVSYKDLKDIPTSFKPIDHYHDDRYYKKNEVDSKLSDKADAINLLDKVDKVEGKQLSTNDFTDELKTKLESLSNYDDTSVLNQIKELKDAINAMSVEISEQSLKIKLK